MAEIALLGNQVQHVSMTHFLAVSIPLKIQGKTYVKLSASKDRNYVSCLDTRHRRFGKEKPICYSPWAVAATLDGSRARRGADSSPLLVYAHNIATVTRRTPSPHTTFTTRWILIAVLFRKRLEKAIHLMNAHWRDTLHEQYCTFHCAFQYTMSLGLSSYSTSIVLLEVSFRNLSSTSRCNGDVSF